MRCKEVINIKDGVCLGPVGDVEVDTCTANLLAIVVFGRSRCFGLLGREEDIVIRWCDIEVIGEDTILVRHDEVCRRRKKNKRFFSMLFGND